MPATTWTVPAVVVRIVDGDTLILDLDLGWGIHRPLERCRLAGINCPELDTPEGLMAKVFTTEQVPVGSKVTFASKRLDNYGRPLGHVMIATGTLSDAILAAGHAVPM